MGEIVWSEKLNLLGPEKLAEFEELCMKYQAGCQFAGQSRRRLDMAAQAFEDAHDEEQAELKQNLFEQVQRERESAAEFAELAGCYLTKLFECCAKQYQFLQLAALPLKNQLDSLQKQIEDLEEEISKLQRQVPRMGVNSAFGRQLTVLVQQLDGRVAGIQAEARPVERAHRWICVQMRWLAGFVAEYPAERRPPDAPPSTMVKGASIEDPTSWKASAEIFGSMMVEDLYAVS